MLFFKAKLTRSGNFRWKPTLHVHTTGQASKRVTLLMAADALWVVTDSKNSNMTSEWRERVWIYRHIIEKLVMQMSDM